MTIEQKQCLLRYLGHYRGAIDGIWGKQSTAATRKFQESQGLTPDGVFGADTETAILAAICREEDTWWDRIEFFQPEEFSCRCGRFCSGYPAQPDRVLVQCADGLRRQLGVPITVSSGLRCPRHNANVGGVANSRHLRGKAMDFCAAGKTSDQILALVQNLPEVRYAYAIDSHYVHMDVD